MSLSDQLLADLHNFVSETGMSRSALGQAAIGDPAIVGRLERGKTVTLNTAQRLYDFMAAERKRRALARAEAAVRRDGAAEEASESEGAG